MPIAAGVSLNFSRRQSSAVRGRRGGKSTRRSTPATIAHLRSSMAPSEQGRGAGPRSCIERALRVMPGGVNSPVRAMGQIGREPIFIERGEGCELVDVDGNRYLDWVGSWGPLILGHADPEVLAAVSAAAARGTSYGAATAAEVELAEEVAAPRAVGRDGPPHLLRHRGGDERGAPRPRRHRPRGRGQVRRRLPRPLRRPARRRRARAWRRSRSRPARASRRPRRRRPSSSPGTIARRSSAALDQHAVAALLAEPVAANMGVVPPAEGFLEFLRDATREAGALLVFDEVITGFRVARGGAQELYGVEPDLTVLGKVLGGGLPAAAFGGPRETMESIAPAGDVYQAGTLSGNPLAVAAGLTTLRRLDSERLRAARRADRPTRRRAARARRRPPPPGRLGARPAHPLLQRRPGRATSPPRRPATSTPTPASAAPCWTRGVYPPPRSSRPGSSRWRTTRRRSTAPSTRPPARSRRRSDERAGRARSTAARRPAPRGGDADLPARRRRPREARLRVLRSSTPSARATCSTTESRACSRATTTTSACSPATISMRSASKGWRRSATPPPSSSSPT